MIVPARSIIVPVSAIGWKRPFAASSGSVDRNYSFPDGKPGLISGIVAEVPAGSDIKPYLSDTTNTQVNCQLVLRYAPPSFLKLTFGVGGYNPFTFEHDMVCQGMDGRQIEFIRPNPGAEGIFGTFFEFFHATTLASAINLRTFRYEYRTQRDAYLEVVEYEQGVDGICNVVINNSYAEPVNAYRLSDGTWQVLTKGRLILRAGAGRVDITYTWNNGLIDAMDTVAKLQVTPEIPYGL